MAACRDRVPSAGTRTLAVGNSCDKGDTSLGGRKGVDTALAFPRTQNEATGLTQVGSWGDPRQPLTPHEGVALAVGHSTRAGDTCADCSYSYSWSC